MSTDEREEWLTSIEAGERLDRSPAWVRRLCNTGQLPGARKIGRDWIIPASAVASHVPRPTGYPAGKKRGGK